MKTFLILLTMFAVGLPDTSKEARNAAVTWATANRAAAYDAMMPRAMSEVVSFPVCRITTLRSSGSIDTFEYAVRLVEPCVSLSPSGKEIKSRLQGEFLIADRSPVTEQLAQIRLADPTVTLDRATAQLRMRRISLSDAAARLFVRDVSAFTVSAQPPLEIVMDGPIYDLASATRMTARSFEVNAQTTRAERRITALARRLASEAGYSDAQLRYDASAWN